MAFSFRSFFGKGGPGNGAAATIQSPENMSSAPIASSFQSVSDPDFANTMLFKTAGAESPADAPVASSPVAPAGGTPAAGLTIGDLLPSIPTDVAKDPGLPLSHPVSFPSSVLDGALRSGRASIPLYELFRACPAMFLVPVGPHDPREVPLPPHKIANLIPGARAAVAPQSPFALVSAHGAPPRSNPFSTVSPPREDSPPATSPADDASTLFKPTPFGLMTEPAPAPAADHEVHAKSPAPSIPASPFSPAVDPAMAGSPFLSAPAMTASSPFSLTPEPAPADASLLFPAPSPFAAAPDLQPPTPLPAFPSMFNGPVVQSVPGVGSSSQASSFLSASPPAPQAAASPFMQMPAAPSPFAAAPAGPTEPPSTPPASWAPPFPLQSSLDSAPVSLPGVGAALFAVSESAQPAGVIGRAESAPPTAFIPSFGTGAAPAPSPAATGFGDPAPSSPSPQPSNAATFPAAPSKPFNPFERIQALAKTAEDPAAPAAGSFTKAPDIDTASLFGGSPLPPNTEPGTPTQSPVLPPTAPACHGESEIKLNLAASLKNCAAHDLGTNPENIPSWVQFTLRHDALAAQLSTGRVVVPLHAIIAGLDPPIRSLFSQARSGVQVELPSNAVLRAVSEAPAAAMPPAAPADPAPQAAKATPPAPLFDPFSLIPENSWEEKEPETPAPEQPFWSATTPSSEGPVSSDSPQPPTTEPPFVPVADQIPVPPPPARAEPVIIPANPLTGAPEFVSPAPVPPPQGSFIADATPRSDNATRRLLLTVLLGSPDAADPAAIVQLTAQLPGVAAVLCVKDNRSIAEAGADTPDSQRFLRDAPAKISGLSALASLTGIDDAETLHIQSGQVEATFCMQGAMTFAVLHDPRRREPTLKEKITLLGRELAAMLGETPAG